MAEIVGTFLRTELWDKRADCSIEGWNGSRSHFAQECFEFAVRHLDWIEVWRVLRQVANRRPRFLNRLSNTGNQVHPAVIHDDDVIAPERENQALLDIGEKHLTVHGTLDHHWRGHFIVAQGGHEGDCLPCSERNGADHPDAPWSSPPEPHHVGADRRLIDKHQPGRIKHALLSNPTSARLRHICSLPFGSLQAFFLRVMLCRSRNRQSELRLVLIRRLRSSATASTKVRSGCSAIRAKTSAANSSSGEMLPPRGFGAALLFLRQRCSHFTADATLTSKRSAASRRDAPVSTASITRSRRSQE